MPTQQMKIGFSTVMRIEQTTQIGTFAKVADAIARTGRSDAFFVHSDDSGARVTVDLRGILEALTPRGLLLFRADWIRTSDLLPPRQAR